MRSTVSGFMMACHCRGCFGDKFLASSLEIGLRKCCLLAFLQFHAGMPSKYINCTCVLVWHSGVIMIFLSYFLSYISYIYTYFIDFISRASQEIGNKVDVLYFNF